MTKKSAPKPDDQKQYERFLEAARDAKAAETEEAADRAFKRIAKAPKAKESRRQK